MSVWPLCAKLTVAYCFFLCNLWDSTTDLHLLTKGTSSSLMPQCLGQRQQCLCSFFYADLKGYMSKWEHSIKYGFCLGPTSVASSPPTTNSQPVSMSPCMNPCKWMFFVMWRLQSGGRLTLEMLYDYLTNTNSGCNLDHTELFFGMDEGWGGVKFQRVSLCVSNLVKTQRREFDRVITHLWFCHLCGWIYYPERDRAKLRFCWDISSPLCHRSGNCSSHCLLFITKIQTLRMSFCCS